MEKHGVVPDVIDAAPTDDVEVSVVTAPEMNVWVVGDLHMRRGDTILPAFLFAFRRCQAC
jgi:hypothetical protein